MIMSPVQCWTVVELLILAFSFTSASPSRYIEVVRPVPASNDGSLESSGANLPVPKVATEYVS